MPNEFFEMHSSPEKYDEVYDKWLRATLAEQKNLNAPKSRIYVSVEDIDIIQNCIQITIQTGAELGGLEDERRLMQMGYGLEQIKHKLQKRIAKETKFDG